MRRSSRLWARTPGRRSARASWPDSNRSARETARFATGLKELDLGFNPLADLRQLASLPALESLNLDGSTLDLGPLATLQGLRRLSVRHNLPDDLQPLAALAALTELDGDNRIENRQVLAGLTGLAVLRADRNLGPKTGLDGLRRLDLRGGSMSGLQPLRGLPSLVWVHVGGSRVADLAPLVGLDGLTVVGQDDRESPSTGGGRAQRSKSLEFDSAGQ